MCLNVSVIFKNMPRRNVMILFIVIWIFAAVKYAECLMCVRCSSLFQRQSCISGQMAPKNCSTSTKYCTKYEGTVKISQDKFVTRDCSDEMEEPGCRDTVMHDKDVRICYSACQTDGCNQGSPLLSGYPITYVISSVCVVFMYL